MLIWAWIIRHTGPSGSRSLCFVENTEGCTAVAIGGNSSVWVHFFGYEPAAQASSNVVISQRDKEGSRQPHRKTVVERTNTWHVHDRTARSLIVVLGGLDRLLQVPELN